MTLEQIIGLGRGMLEMALLLSLPLLAVAIVVSLLLNILQVLTSLQENTLAAVPRLAAVAGAAFVLLPWMLRRMEGYTLHLFSDFGPFVR